MSALQKLKAYFGMVPADELEEYEEDRYGGGYGSAYQPGGEPEFDTYGDRVASRRRPLGSPRPVSRLDATEDYGGYDDGTQPSYPQTWYYCADPAGYYPYVTQCYTGWQAVSG